MIVSNNPSMVARADPYEPFGNFPTAGIARKNLPGRSQVSSVNEIKDISTLSPVSDSTGIPSEVKSTDKSENSFSFRDFLDIINPLQHIPIISNIYRAISHDEIKSPARVLGGGLFGGIVGAAVGLANTVFSKATGRYIGEHVLALFKKDDVGGGLALQVAKAQETQGQIDETTSASGSAAIFHDAAVETSGKTQIASMDPDPKSSTPDDPSLHRELIANVMIRALDDYQRMKNADMKIDDQDKEGAATKLDIIY